MQYNIGMSEVIKDSAIKLFGRTISLPRINDVSANGFSSEPTQDSSDHKNPPSSSSFPREVSSTTIREAERDKEPSRKELTSTQDHDEGSQEEPRSSTSSGNMENPKTPSTERETSLLKPASKNEDQSDTTSLSQDKAPKKPDKVLACPRCNSMDTKFCYYNNYNVNQPRHFCKHCQRYWTAGGTMRNVPIGAGRRKNKNTPSSASHYRQIMLPETLQNGSLHTSAVLTFGSDSPLCDSMASVLSLADKSLNGVLNGFHAPKQNPNTSGDDVANSNSVGASIMASTLFDNAHEESVDNKSYQGFPPWSFPWNPTMTLSGFCHPVPFYPTPPLWGCMPVPPPSWSVHSFPTSSGPNSPTLGKHSRDGDIILQTEKSSSNMADNKNNSVLIPKTLRIDDPSEAAKSSIWSTLGIKNEKGNSLNEGGLFRALASKGDEKNKNHVMVVEASPVLQANPAALSRSIVFHERT
ncbi:hypothetical protein Fmac_003232 [Flemingia macrophylla]|uniref:Dof-type domain-containing protein n=1 Tax=Flemingia macrophylla TaxID=520843 RepID=A0ABD1NNM1_9FABA